jgi:hypothetical protein
MLDRNIIQQIPTTIKNIGYPDNLLQEETQHTQIIWYTKAHIKTQTQQDRENKVGERGGRAARDN